MIDETALALSALGPHKMGVLAGYVEQAKTRPGAAAEVGVWRGGAARVIARGLSDKRVYLFDTFEGIPERGEHDSWHSVGDFSDTSLETVKANLADCPNVKFHVGRFPDTASGLESEQFCFVHIDGDQYQVTKDALEFFYPRLVEGGVMLFDDYQFANCPGVAKAVDEFIADKPELIEYLYPAQGVIVKGKVPQALQDGVLDLNVGEAWGMGDVITGYYVACGAADAGYQVRYYVRHPGWLERVAHPRVTVLPYEAKGVDLSAGYIPQLYNAVNRKRWYCDNIHKALKLPPGTIKSTSSFTVDRAIAETHQGDYVVLAPFSAWESRHWPIQNWRYLVKLLHDRGIRCVALDGPGDGKRLIEGFGSIPSDFGCSWAWGGSVEYISNLMLGARAVIGIDSGLAHYGGLLGVPTYAIMAHLSPDFVFSETGVQGITPDTKCAFCRWIPERGFNAVCDAGCSALGSISPDRVVAAIGVIN